MLRIRIAPGSDARDNMRSLLSHLKSLGFAPETVIDVGVADGTFELYDTFPRSRQLLVEPLAEFEHVLRYLQRRYGAEYVLAAAGPSDGVTRIETGSNAHGASVLTDQMEEGSQTRPGREVPLARLDTLVKERQLPGPYLIKVDVQGYELEVMEGATGLLPQTEVVILEASMFRFTSNLPVLDAVIASMKERGFVPYEIFGGYNRPLDDAMAGVDIAFVQENGRFRSSHLFATPEQAERHAHTLGWRLRQLLSGWGSGNLDRRGDP